MLIVQNSKYKKSLVAVLGTVLFLGVGVAVPKLTVRDAVVLTTSEMACVETSVNQNLGDPLHRLALMLGESAVVEKTEGNNTIVVQSYTLYRIPFATTHIFYVSNEQVGACDYARSDAEVPSTQTITPVTLVNGQTYSSGVFHDGAVVGGLKSFSSQALGISFEYPSDYVLFESEGQYEQYIFHSFVMAPSEPMRQAIARAQAGFAGEGPEAITITFISNPKSFTLEEWLKSENSAYTNYHSDDPTNALAPTTVAGVPAFKYHSDLGLYANDYAAFQYGAWVVEVSAATDLKTDFASVLANIQLKP